MEENNCRPQPGDLIEINRPLHKHWALYVGDGYVVNLTPVGKQDVELGLHKVPVFTRKVKKQCLKEVVGKDNWCVNNKSDENHDPLPAEEIIRRAEGYVGKEVTYRVFGSNCEHFVKKLRYGDQVSASVGGEVTIPDMTYDRQYPKPGDLIEIKRGYFEHWALYLGDGNVIHATTAAEGAPSLSASSETRLIRMAKVKKELLKDVAGNDDWDVNNKYDCHRIPLPVEKIIQRAEQWIGSIIPYEVLGSNSEGFVRKLRYGGQLRASVGDEETIPDMSDDKQYPKLGDLVEIKQGCYEHWAIYVGDGDVIHVTPVDEGAPSLSASSETNLIRKAQVKKELLKDVAGNDDWDVNNKYDCLHTPLPVEKIIQRAEQWIGSIAPYDVLGSNPEGFVRKLRYGGQVRASVGGKVTIPDMTDDKQYPKPGDLIEFKRRHYQHWAVYVGDGNVIHVTNTDDNPLPQSAGSETKFARKAQVKKQPLNEVAEDDYWCVNNKYDHFRIPFPTEEIVRRAEPWVDIEVPYNVLGKNCEHFGTMLRYGQGFSDQAKKAVGSAHLSSSVATGLSSSLYALPSVPALLAAEVGLFGLHIINMGLGSVNIVHLITFDKFRKAEKDILQQKCC